jgi:hypothetical protein
MGVPAQSPGAGRRWALQQNVVLFDGTGLGIIQPLAVPPSAGGVNSFTHGANYGLAGASAYALETVHYAQIKTYLDSVQYGLMAVEPGKASASGYISVPGGITWAYATSTAIWPVNFTITYVVTSSTPGGVLGVNPTKIVGDVWAAIAVDSDLTTLVPGSPLVNPSSLNRARAGLQLAWSRREGRVDRTQHTLGTVGGLTYPGKWDGEKTYLMDGYELHWAALHAGGASLGATYHFVKLPDTDASGTAGGTGTPFTFDITPFDDPGHPWA